MSLNSPWKLFWKLSSACLKLILWGSENTVGLNNLPIFSDNFIQFNGFLAILCGKVMLYFCLSHLAVPVSCWQQSCLFLDRNTKQKFVVVLSVNRGLMAYSFNIHFTCLLSWQCYKITVTVIGSGIGLFTMSVKIE